MWLMDCYMLKKKVYGKDWKSTDLSRTGEIKEGRDERRKEDLNSHLLEFECGGLSRTCSSFLNLLTSDTSLSSYLVSCCHICTAIGGRISPSS